MRGWLALAGLLAGMAAWSAPASASTEMGCGTVWTLEAQSRLCASRVVIGPGNDTRVNMLLLLRDRAGLPVDGDYPQDDPWYVADLGRTFFDWSRLTRTLYPQPEGDAAGPDNAFGGTRCQSVEQGGAEFLAAADRNRRINARDRARLAAGRAALLAYCQANAGSDSGAAPDGFADMVMPSAFSSDVAREFGIYVAGAASFYAGDWRGAKARSPWPISSPPTRR